MQHFRQSLILLFLFIPLLGCLNLNPFSTAEPETTVGREHTSGVAPSTKDSIPTLVSPGTSERQTGSTAGAPGRSYLEILWQVPTEPVEAFRLSYGFSADKLDTEIRIPVESLQKLDDPAFGPVFSYQIPDVAPNATIYFSLQAENQGLISPPTPTIRVSNTEIVAPGGNKP